MRSRSFLPLLAALLLGSWLAPASVRAALSVSSLDDGVTATDLVQTLLGPGVTASNVVFSGANLAAGTFTGGTDSVGFNRGIVLGSGRAIDVVGPNDADGTTTQLGLGGDADLDALVPGFDTLDATVLEFDFVPTTGQVEFQYVFASDEYNEYVNSAYNDVFGFFVNGANRALLPDDVTVVSINNVNGGKPFGTGASNPDFYLNNDCNDGGCPIDAQFDGRTIVLTLTAPRA